MPAASVNAGILALASGFDVPNASKLWASVFWWPQESTQGAGN